MAKLLKKKHLAWLEENFKNFKNNGDLSRALIKADEKHFKDALPDSVRRACSRFLEDKKLTSNVTRLEDTEEFIKASNRKLRKSKYYIITWQQNETPVYKPFGKIYRPTPSI